MDGVNEGLNWGPLSGFGAGRAGGEGEGGIQREREESERRRAREERDGREERREGWEGWRSQARWSGTVVGGESRWDRPWAGQARAEQGE